MKHILGFCLLLGTTCVLADNLDDFKSIIEIVNSLNTTWKANTNIPDDFTISSFEKLLGALLFGRDVRTNTRKDLPDMDIPEEFDARTEWPDCPTISQIRDQGKEGTCWAVATAAAFSDRLCIASGGNLTLPLSAEELVDCCDYCGDGAGGYPAAAWEFFTEPGLVTGGELESGIGCQPFCSSHDNTTECQQECTNPEYETPFEEDIHKVESSYVVVGEKEIQKEILTYGPVAASFITYVDFATYESGIYQKTTGERRGAHSVRLLGWGSEDGTPYWLAANSWGPDWGEDGLFRFIRGRDECSIESGVSAGVPSL